MAGDSSWTTLLVLPLVAFVVGRTLPYAVSPLLGSIRLPPGTPALASFWIACLAGLGFLAAPLVAYWLASPWFAELWPSLSPANRGGALFAAMGTGIAAYLAGPLLLYLDRHPAIDVDADEHRASWSWRTCSAEPWIIPTRCPCRWHLFP